MERALRPVVRFRRIPDLFLWVAINTECSPARRTPTHPAIMPDVNADHRFPHSGQIHCAPTRRHKPPHLLQSSRRQWNPQELSDPQPPPPLVEWDSPSPPAGAILTAGSQPTGFDVPSLLLSEARPPTPLSSSGTRLRTRLRRGRQSSTSSARPLAGLPDEKLMCCRRAGPASAQGSGVAGSPCRQA